MPALPTASIPCQRECSNSTSITQTRGQVLPRATSAHWAKMTGRANSALKLTIGRYESALHANLSNRLAQPWAVWSRAPRCPVTMNLLLAAIPSSESGLLGRVSLKPVRLRFVPLREKLLSCAGWISSLNRGISHWSFCAHVPATPPICFPIKPSTASLKAKKCLPSIVDTCCSST